MPDAINSAPLLRSPLTIAILALSGSLLYPSLNLKAAEELPELIITADPLDSSELSQRVDRTQAREIKDLFSLDSEASVGGGDRQARRLYLRGLEGSNINITVDGARQGQNMYNHRGGLLGVDPFILKRVEVQPGPVAADAGAGALGGSLRFETKDAQDLLQPNQRMGAKVRTAYASATEAKTLNLAAFGEITPGLGILAYAGGTNTEDIRIGGGNKIPQSAYEDRNQLIKLSWLGHQDHQLRISHEHNTTQGTNFQQRGDYPYQVQPDIDQRPPRDQTLSRNTSVVNYRYAPKNPYLDLEVNAYMNANEWKSPDNQGERFTSDTQGGKIQNTVTHQWQAIQNRLTLGLDYFQDEGAAYGTTRWPDNTKVNQYENTGYYLQNRLDAGRWQVSAGVRLDDFSATYQQQTLSDSAIAVNATLSFDITDEWQAHAGYGEANRGFGNIPVHFARAIREDASINTNPETARQYETGITFQQKHTQLLGGRLDAQVTLFKTDIDDLILYRHASGSGGMGSREVEALYNHDQTLGIEGLTLKLGWENETFRTQLALTTTDISNLPQGSHFAARTAAPTGDTLIWDNQYLLQDNLALGYTLTWVQDFNEVKEGYNQGYYHMKREGYTTHDVQLRWKPTALKDLTLAFAIYNLLDKEYSHHTSLAQGGFATQEPGRDFRISAQYQF